MMNVTAATGHQAAQGQLQSRFQGLGPFKVRGHPLEQKTLHAFLFTRPRSPIILVTRVGPSSTGTSGVVCKEEEAPA